MSRATVISVRGTPSASYHEAGFSTNFASGKGPDGTRRISDAKITEGVLSFITRKNCTIYWGNYFDDKSIAPLAVGSALNDRWYPMVVIVRIKQSLPQSRWKLELRRRREAPRTHGATLRGTQWQDLIIPLGDSRAPARSFALIAEDPDNHVQIESVRVATPTARQCFRGIIHLDDAPADASIDVFKRPWQKLYINGQEVGSITYPAGGTNWISGKTYTDLARFFKKGDNVIAVESEYFAWMGPSGGVVVDGIVKMQGGRIARVMSDASWRAAYNAPQGWQQLAFDDSQWEAAKSDKPFFKIMEANYNPIAIKSPGKYFIFQSADPVSLSVSVPPYIAADSYNVRWRIADAQSGNEVKDGTLAKDVEASKSFDGRITSPLDPGAYEVTVDVTAGGKTVESNTQEFVVVGKIAQREVAGTSYTDGLDLELTDDVDLTDPASPYKIFSQSRKGDDVPSRIIESKAGKYRQSGDHVYDWFGFAVKLDAIYQPYLVEVDYPDDAQRIMSVRTMEMTGMPGGLANDRTGTRGWGLTAPGMDTGIEKRLTYKSKTLRYIIFPKVPVTGFVFMTQHAGMSAAASRVRIYRIKNGLPALKIGSPDVRLTGQHLERITLIPITFEATPDEWKFAINYSAIMHRGFYKNWYNSIDNLIRYMRFTGENMLIAGIYMYYPENGNFWNNKETANAAELLGRMCAANGIKVFLGVEYARPESAKVKRVTDEEVAHGAPTLFTVSKDGKQVANWDSCTNMFAPVVRQDLIDKVKQLSELYKNTPGIVGLAFQEGNGSFLPCICYSKAGTKDPLDFGYGDVTIDLFARETGLKIPGEHDDPNRFAQRYDWIMKNVQEQWIDWRNRKVHELNRTLADTIAAANPNWKMYIFPHIFYEIDGTPLEKMRRSSFDPRLYANDKTIVFGGVYNNRIRFFKPHQESLFVETKEWSEDPDTIKLRDRNASFVHVGFFEATQRSDTWYYDTSLCGDYVWQSGRDFLDSFSRIMSYATPQCMAQTWLDVDMMSGYEQERREFNRAFRVLPEGHYQNLTGNGLDANIAVRASTSGGKTSFYVVNRSGWPIETTLRLKLPRGATVTDLALGNTLALDGNDLPLHMDAYAMRSLQLSGDGKIVSAETHVSPEAADELKDFALTEAQAYSSVQQMANDRLASELKSLKTRISVDQLKELSRKIVAAANSGDYLTVATMTDSYTSMAIEAFLSRK